MVFFFHYFKVTSYAHFVWVVSKIDCPFIKYTITVLEMFIQRGGKGVPNILKRKCASNYGTVGVTLVPIQPHLP